MQVIKSLFGDPLLSSAGVALVIVGIFLSIRKRTLAALPLLLLGTACLVVAGPNRGPLDELTLDTHGKVTIKFKAIPTPPETAPNATVLQKGTISAIGKASGSSDLIRDLEHQASDVLNPFFDLLRRDGFVPILGLPHELRPGDIVDTATGYALIEKQETAFPGLRVSTQATIVPDVTFNVRSQDGRSYSTRITCENATLTEAPSVEFVQRGHVNPTLLLANNTQIVQSVLHCGSFRVHADFPVGGGAGTTLGSREIGARLFTIQAIAGQPSS
ncbi:hypothetical protein [Bradyrhizobium diazoefficiens]|uniref:hypothetical protein n=1 Tax=Bradyrhizobium diazoefficiens TaxID=1355477 RepID=UPI002714D70D|nr:hypothetical protein [Bradyrhizobium diazoefficiens]WLB42289.1 hypothetical protein QIH78_21605 [Bradyrhizobium diazoefficiens]